MHRPLIMAILAWLMLAVSIMYLLEMPWRQWQNRPPKRWMPLYGEFLLPLSCVLAINGNDVIIVRTITAIIMITALLHRLLVRKRLGIPTWPPV